MYICVYVYMYICIYVFMYICIYVYMYICIYVYMHICICVYMYICIHVYMYTCTLNSQTLHFAGLSMLLHTRISYTYIYIYICIYIYIYLFIYMYIFFHTTNSLNPKPLQYNSRRDGLQVLPPDPGGLRRQLGALELWSCVAHGHFFGATYEGKVGV